MSSPSKQQHKHQQHSKTTSLADRPPFDVPATAANLKSYDATTDPFNPHSRTHRLKTKANDGTTAATLLMSKSDSFLTNGFDGIDTKGPGAVAAAALSMKTTMKEMGRPLIPPSEKFPAHQAANTTIGTSGLTYSSEPVGNTAEGKAELEVLKAVLNREGYLMRLFKVVRTVKKKFKPEVADILDLVRAASLDVVESIVKWREVKSDHDAAFMWNGVNYLLKMPSDMDYLSKFLAVQTWMGFSLIRNPFCVPFPMEEGAHKFGERVLDPKHIEAGLPSDGFILGGLTHKSMKKKYGPPKKAKVLNSNPDEKVEGRDTEGESASFILNSDMRKIRQSELVILKEEEKLGKFSRDPNGTVVPLLQAETRIASLELRKDDHRPIDEPSHSAPPFAPHAVKSDIGVAPLPWTPEQAAEDHFLTSDLLHVSDDSVDPTKRGNSKLGGFMPLLEPRGADSRIRKPLNPTLGGSMDFSRQRGLRTLGERLQEISELKQQIIAEKLALDREVEREKSRGSAKFSRGGSKAGLLLESRSKSRGSERDVRNASREEKSDTLKGGIARGGETEEKDKSSRPSSRSANDGSLAADELDDMYGSQEQKGNNDGISSSSADHKFEELKALEEEEFLKSNTFGHINKDLKEIDVLRQTQRDDNNSENSRQVERKRRLLTEEEGERKGPPPREKENVYDFYAVRVQTLIRGWLARCWTMWYRRARSKAAVSVQAGIRGWLARTRVRRFKLRYRSATNIQKMYRGYKARGASAKMAKNRNIGKAAALIQRRFRGYSGKQRAISKKALGAAARVANSSVDSRTVFISDVRELAKRIQYAVEEPLTTSYPPDEVLHMIRMVVMIIQAIRGFLGSSKYDFIDNRLYSEIDGETLTWQEAGKIVGRSERFLRLIKTLAYGPNATPPRLVQVPANAALLYEALIKNSRWNLGTFEKMGSGSKMCCQLFKWITSIVEVAQRQVKFLGFIASSFPEWLPQLFELQSQSRKNEFQIALLQRCIDTMKGFLQRQQHSKDPLLENALKNEIVIVERESASFESKLQDSWNEEDKLRADQVKRELVIHGGMNNRVIAMSEELFRMAKNYKFLATKAAEGDKPSEEELPEARILLTNKEFEVNEAKAQFKLLQVQMDSNNDRRKILARLPGELRSKANAAGESKALNIIAMAKIQVMLQEAGVKWESNLPTDLRPVYNALEAAQLECKEDARIKLKFANDLRKEYDAKLMSELKENEIQEQKSRDKVAPSDAEMEEERREDEREARLEKMKSKQFLPDMVLKKFPERPRPVIIALSRDLPGYSKKKIQEEITKTMPGLFVALDVDENMGLDGAAMQAILDSKHSIIISVDIGLTALTRSTFIKNFNMTIKGLIPNPFTALAIGEEQNKQSISGGAHYGVGKRDLQLSRDCDVKSYLEVMAWAVQEMEKPDLIKLMQQQAADVLPSSPSLVLVLEALLVLFSTGDQFFSPDSGISPGSWRLTQQILAEPRVLANKLRTMARGKSSQRRCECLSQYIQHRHWPISGSTQRIEEPILHVISTYIEKWVACERATLMKGGLPPQALTKGSMIGLQSVIVVSDGIDPDDLFGDQTGSGWRMPAARLIRTALQDLRILKTVCKIDGDTYHISVYREKNNVYFDAYDPRTSHVYMTSVAMENVPYMLMPNSFILSTGKSAPPPSTQEELASQLVQLLIFDRAKGDKDARKVLLCRRDYTFLQNLNTKLDGHRVFIQAYEAALGELYFKVYFPEFSAQVNLLIDELTRNKLFHDQDVALEGPVMSNEDARLLLPYVIDRLRITPSRTIVDAKGLEKFDGYKKNQGLLTLIKSQGFQLKCRLHGGAGRVIYKSIHKIGGTLHLLTLLTSGPSKLMRVIVYEPIAQLSLELRLDSFKRKLLIGSDADDIKNWFPKFIKRLKMNWRGFHSINFDLTIYRAIRKIDNIRMMVDFIAVDENVLNILLVNTLNSGRYSTFMNKEQFVRLIHYMPAADVVKNTFGSSSSISSGMKNMLKNTLIREQSTLASKKGSLGALTKDRELDPILFEVPMYDLLNKEENLVNVADKLQLLLRCDPGDSSNHFVAKSYHSVEPPEVQLKFELVGIPTGRLELDTSLMYVDQLKRFAMDERDYSKSFPIIRQRKQVPILIMEGELDDLALNKSKAAFARIEADMKVAEEVDEYLNNIEDGDQIDEEILDTSSAVTTAILEKIEQKITNRMIERAMPGTTQEVRRQNLLMLAGDGKTTVEVEEDLLTEEQREIHGRGEKVVLESGVKTSFRDHKSRWAGHVSIQVFETICWMGEEGVGRRLRFIVYEPSTASYYEGIIRNSRHLLEVCGVRGADLLNKKRTEEMILFIAKFRMFLAKNEFNLEGEAVEDGAPSFKVEFESERLFDSSKVTPVNLGGDEDLEFNKSKLIDLNQLRGKKIIRVARRVSGVILQLTVFDVPPSEVKKKDDEEEEPRPEEEEEEAEEEDGMGAGQRSNSNQDGSVADLRSKTKVARFEAPVLRVIGYDPRSKRKVIFIASQELILEIAGGVYSPFLNPKKRRDLAKILCESLQLIFPRGKPFELFVAWSGSQGVAGSTAQTDASSTGKLSSWRSSAERVIKRSGKIFRAAMRISKLELLVTLYVQDIPQALTRALTAVNIDEGGGGEGGEGTKTTSAAAAVNGDDEEVYAPNSAGKQLVCNFYSTGASEAAEIVVSEEEQIKRMGKTILSFQEGIIRATAIRRFSRYFFAELLEDPKDMFKKILKVQLVKPKKDFVSEYRNVGVPSAGDDIRPVGVPAVFIPLNTCGRMLHRRGMNIRNSSLTEKEKPPLDYIVTVYTKTVPEGPERGLVLKMYERGHSETAILHIGTTELVRLAEEVNEPDLLKDLVHARNAMESEELDNLEEEFISLTPKGDRQVEYLKLVNYLIDIVLNQLGIKTNPQIKILPFIKSHPRGIEPS